GSGVPLTEATVGILGAQLGVRTNERGEYRLKIPNGGATVLARAIGYKRQTVIINSSQATADFTLEKDVLQLEGVTVTGQATTVAMRRRPSHRSLLKSYRSRQPSRLKAISPARSSARASSRTPAFPAAACRCRSAALRRSSARAIHSTSSTASSSRTSRFLAVS